MRRLLGLKQRTAAPRMIGDIEDHLVRAIELGFVEALVLLRPLGERLGAEFLDIAGHRVNVLDQHAEMVDTAEVGPDPGPSRNSAPRGSRSRR